VSGLPSVLFRIAAEQMHAEATAETRWIAGGSRSLLLGLLRGETRQLIGDAWRCGGGRSDERQLAYNVALHKACVELDVGSTRAGTARDLQKEGEAIGTLQMAACQHARWRGSWWAYSRFVSFMLVCTCLYTFVHAPPSYPGCISS
jgi:hypothetical protein